MNFLNYQSCLKILLKNYKSCSLLNANGALLFSKDENHELLTTTRLVAFQIIKKYLQPKAQDFFVLNDPENGGYHYTKLIFISCLTANLYLIWDENNFYIDFKIPPTPLFEQGVKNDFIWQALINANKYAIELKTFFEHHKNNIDRIINHNDLLNVVASIKNQQLWLKATDEIFSIQFASKAHGTAEAYYQVAKSHFIKLKLSAEEKQNLKLITLDFTNTNYAAEVHTASHVVESALIKKIIDFYQIDEYCTQSVLDKIKVILPPRSIVSKPHLTGKYNFELQAICSQLCDYNIKQFNSQTRKPQTVFEYSNYMNFEIHTDRCHSSNIISSQLVSLKNFEELLTNNSIKMKKMRRIDTASHIAFQVNLDCGIKIDIKNNYYSEKKNNSFKLNNELLQRGQYNLKKDDIVEIIWG